MTMAAAAFLAATAVVVTATPQRAAAAATAASITMCAGATQSTGCPTATATCCHHNFSKTGMGCCPMPNAVCCAGSYGLCCPAAHTCVSTGTFSGTCKPNAAAAEMPTGAPPPPNLFTGGAPQVCTPGPLEPPSKTLPSAIIIGDSVSIGYTPHVISKLVGKVQVQHSPSAGGGGADDTPYGSQCILGQSAGHTENFIRTAKYELAKWDVITFNFGLVRGSQTDRVTRSVWPS